MTIWTIGHSNRTREEFLELLSLNRIERLVDVRKIPRSRRNPQFAIDQLPATLAALGIEYVHVPELGGLRRPRPDSVNSAWRNDSFRGYADYMQTAEFSAAIETLTQLASGARRTVMMCAESLPWQCHRSLIADSLMAQGAEVLHIIDKRTPAAHVMTSFSQLTGGSVTYPGLL